MTASTPTTRKPSPVRPLDTAGTWLSEYKRYFEYAHIALTDLEKAAEELRRVWPVPLGQTIRTEQTPELWDLTRRRDMLSDSVKIYSAMTIEAFLNFYGVIRLGESEYVTHFERFGLIPKLRTLLLVCDSLSVSKADPLVKILDRIATRRNALVHPKTKELSHPLPVEERPGDRAPEVAREAVSDMENFFKEFAVAIPDARHLVPNGQRN